MNLLDLPAELVRGILYELEPEAFYMCMLTNKLFREHALASTSLLLKQISRIPGIDAKQSDGHDAATLMNIFVKRATQHLRHGAWMTDVHSWRSDGKTDRKSSTILKLSLCNPMNGKHSCQLAYAHVRDDASVHVYFIEKGGETGQEYLPRLKHVITPHSVQGRYPCKEGLDCTIRVLKVAPYTPRVVGYNIWTHIAVLYLVTLRDSNSNVLNSWRKITIFGLDANFGPLIVETLDPAPQSTIPEDVTAMAVSSERVVVVVSEQHGIHNNYHVNFYWKWRDESSQECYTSEETVYTRAILEPLNIHYGERIGSVSIYGNHVLLSPTTIPLPQWNILHVLSFPRSHGIQGRSQFTRRWTDVPDTCDFFARPLLGRAIASHHYCRVRDEDGNERCINAVLELMISREPSHSHPDTTRKGAYLLKALDYPNSCVHFDLERDYDNLDHYYVAELVGLPDLQNLSTLGLKLAVSPKAYRIAIASWKSVKVWSLDPKAFLDPDYGLRGGRSDLVPSDYAYTEGCGWQFYDCEYPDQLCVALEPVELPSSRVVYGLEFRDEDELWGWCEDGIVKWSFGARATAKIIFDAI